METENKHGNKKKTVSTHQATEEFGKYCRVIKDFPKPGISFKDITPLLLDGQAFHRVIKKLCAQFLEKVDIVVCIEARGFLIGAPMAFCLKCGLIPVRKKGKLPSKTLKASYDLEYGSDTLEIHADAIQPGQNILIVDDVLATGGTARSVVNLVREMKGNVIGCVFLGELTDLQGRIKIDAPIYSLIKF